MKKHEAQQFCERWNLVAPIVDWRPEAKRGECYMNAFRFVIDNPDWTLVHGICRCTNRETPGEMGHAWAELSVDLHLPVGTIEWTWVADPTARKIYPREIYYNAGKVKFVRHYSREESNRLALETEHYGAWDRRVVKVQHQEERRRAKKG